MLSRNTLKFLYLSFFVISCVNAAKEEEKKKEKKEDLTVDVTLSSWENVTSTPEAGGTLLKANEGYRFKTLKVGDKTLYNVDTSKYDAVHLYKLTHDSDEWLKLLLHPAKPVMFKKKSDKEYSEVKFETYYDDVLFKGKSAKELDASKVTDTGLFTQESFGTGKKYTFNNSFKPSKVSFDKKDVGKPDKAKFLDVFVYVGSDDKKVVRLDYFFGGDSRLKEVYFELKDDKWVKMEQNDANKALHAMSDSWKLDYKPVVDKFSPLAVLASVLIVAASVFYNL
ncbi:merozoite surface antigen p32 [Theileria parva strain Muguga]|uniref:32 kDa surface antigen n=3 Tax=Theileria parva TaxID=5875 RepID=Q27030_THEPA|nr:merozoite surface antigen p32 [Theileria parva strain Muguga]AAA75252.1 32 kDa surface antigen [Theileria parva]EAN34294.1 merozoite surface antigen p32 [Theileria parva strain Muguga]CAB93689.1 Ms1 protein [Theileria parva]|eukprot:XP_766577.1 32 kDa surface antigen [Theileria parva strain Muguga]